MDDIEIFSHLLNPMPTDWDGRNCILLLKSADFQWRQMEWMGFYFEYQCKRFLSRACETPGDRFGNVEFDLKRNFNWDTKASAIKSINDRIILNDKSAMDQSIKLHGSHGEIIARCDVEYNDADRSFQKWHSDLKGGKSTYETDREDRKAPSRLRKTHAELVEIVLVVLKESDLEHLSIYKQGRNSDGSPRNVKYVLNFGQIENFHHKKLKFID